MSSTLIIFWRILALLGMAVFGVWLLVKLLMVLGWLLGGIGRSAGCCCRRVGCFVRGMLNDAVRLVGGAITATVFIPLVVANVVLGHWSRANHYSRALEREGLGLAQAAWRLVLGHPARLLGLESLVEGFERRIPEAMARAPGPDGPAHGEGFEGYRITGSLPSGGSGARLFLAEPTPEKLRQLERTGIPVPDRVVIKSFSLQDGSSMPQIVRESRALEAARNLGLVLEHSLAGTRFHYVMPYVPGEDLQLVTQRMHARSGPEGLGDRQLGQAMSYIADLLGTLHRFHAHGLWHKDVKPNNIIVSDGRVHLVDLGLITPLTSAMTLTTHGTEYFRDPELVRLALRGVKVHEVDGVKFDIYGAGAVLYSLIENSFPAHGSLSQITRRCPEALRWIVRRSMADMGNRYADTTEMLADLRALLGAADPMAFRPAQLPSMSTHPEQIAALQRELERAQEPSAHSARVGLPTIEPDAPDEPRRRPRLRLVRSRRRRHAGNVAASRSKGGMALGVLGLGVALMMATGAFLMTGRMEQHGHPTVTHTPTHPTRVPLILRSQGQTGPGELVPDWLARRPEPSRLLLIDDVPAAASDQTRQAVHDRLDSLEQARFELVGEGREHSLGEAREIELRAEARKALELSSPQDPEAASRLLAFVTRHRDELDGLLWIGRDGDSPDQVRYQVITGSPEDGLDARTLLQPTAQHKINQQVYSIY